MAFASISGYGLQFSATWASSRHGFSYTLEFYEKDTTDEVSLPTFDIAPRGLVRTTGTRGADPNAAINESRLDIELIDPDDVIYYRLSGSVDKTWKVSLESGSSVIGRYFIVPDSVQRSSGPDNETVRLSAVDGLSYLSSVAYAPASGGTYEGRDTVRDITQKALALSGISVSLVNHTEWYPFLTNALATSDDPLDHLRMDQSWFVDEDGNPYTARAVLEEIAGRFGARIFQSRHGWMVKQRNVEDEDFQFAFQYAADGSVLNLGTLTSTRVEDVDMTRLDGGTETKSPAWRQASSAYAHGGLKGSNTVTEGLTGNGSFDIWDEGSNMPEGWRISPNFSSNIDAADISRKSPIVAQTGFSLQIDGIYYPNQPSHPNDQGDGWIELDVPEAYWAFTADATGDTLNVTGHPYSEGDQVQVFSDGTLPAGLSANTTYYVVSVLTDSFKVSEEEGGTAVDITDTGTGTHYVHFIDLPYYVEGGIDRHIVWQGRAKLEPTLGSLDYTATYDIRVQRYIEGKDHTWHLKEDGTWSIDTEYTMSVGGAATTIGTLPSDHIVAELQDSNGDDVSGVVRMRLFRQEDANTTDGSEPLSAVRFDDFGVLYQETTESKAEPETTYTTVSEDDSDNHYAPGTRILATGDGPTAAHQGRLTVIDANGEEVMVTGGWKEGAYSGESSTGYSVDEILARILIQQRRTAVKRRYESFFLKPQEIFPFYNIWKRNISVKLLGGLSSSTPLLSGPVDVGRVVTIPTDSGDVERTVLSIKKEGDNYRVTIDSAIANGTGDGDVTYTEEYTPTYLREYFWTGEIEGEFVQYLRDTDDTGLTVTTEKKSGDDADAPTVQRITQSYGGGRVIPSISTLQSSAGGTDQAAHVPEEVKGGLFKWDSSGTSDGGTKFSDGSGGIWSRVYGGVMNARWFGASPSLADNASALQSAINAAHAADAELYIPPGTYAVASPLSIPTTASGNALFKIRGAGLAATIIKPSASFSGTAGTSGLTPIIDAAGTDANRAYVQIEDIGIDGSSALVDTVGLYLNYNTPYTKFVNVFITGCTEGCRSGNNWLVQLNQCRMVSNETGLRTSIDIDDSGGVTNAWQIIGGAYTANTTYGIYLGIGRNNALIGPDVSATDTSIAGLYGQFQFGLNLSSVYFENASGATISAWATSTSYVVGDRVTADNDLTYTCISGHTSDSTTKPRSGGSWTTVWSYSAGIVLDSCRGVSVSGHDTSVWDDGENIMLIQSSRGVSIAGMITERGASSTTTFTGTGIVWHDSTGSMGSCDLRNVSRGMYIRNSTVTMDSPEFAHVTTPIETFNHSAVELFIRGIDASDVSSSSLGADIFYWIEKRDGTFDVQGFEFEDIAWKDELRVHGQVLSTTGDEGGKLIFDARNPSTLEANQWANAPYIASIMTGADGDQVGIIFYVHPSATFGDAAEEGFRVTHNKKLQSAGDIQTSGVYRDSNGTQILTDQQPAIANISTSANSGTLPTPDGSMTIADAANPTNAELLEYCRELEGKLEEALSMLRTHALIDT